MINKKESSLGNYDYSSLMCTFKTNFPKGLVTVMGDVYGKLFQAKFKKSFIN